MPCLNGFALKCYQIGAQGKKVLSRIDSKK